MRRGRGDKTSKAERLERQAKVVEGLKAGKTQAEIQEELQVSRATMWRTMTALAERFTQAVSDDDLTALKRAQLDALRCVGDAVLKGTVEPEVSNAWARLNEQVSRLLGLDAPQKRVVAHLDAESSPLFLRFKKSIAGLSDDQVEEVLRAAAAMPRERREPAKDASWWPQPPRKEIPDGAA